MKGHPTPFTIDALERIVEEMTTEEVERREKLTRLIQAYARILAIREPKRFVRAPLWHGDEPGHYDSSYPPSQVYLDHSGPRLLEVYGGTTQDIPTSEGFYYSWRRVTTDPGIFVGPDGRLWGANETGEGSLGQFAAHPGDCGVECEVEWRLRDMDDVSTGALEAAEKALRDLAFPYLAERRKRES